MLRSKKGVTFVSVVGTVMFMAIITTLIFSFVGNNGLLVNKYQSNHKVYNKASDSLKSAANFLVEKSSNQTLTVVSLKKLINETLDLPSNFGIDEVDETNNFREVEKDVNNNIPYKGIQIKLTKDNFYIIVFLSDDGSLKALSNIFFDGETAIDFVYKTGFLTASFLYENELYFDTSNNKYQPIKYQMHCGQSQFEEAANNLNDSIYSKLLPDYVVLDKDQNDTKRRRDYLFETVDDKLRYKESYVDNDLIDHSIAECIPEDSVFELKGKTWKDLGYITEFNVSTRPNNPIKTYFIKGDLVLSDKGASTEGLTIGDNTTVYIQGNLNMDHSPVFQKSSTEKAYSQTYLKLGNNSALIVGGKTVSSTISEPNVDNPDYHDNKNLWKPVNGNIIIRNENMMPKVVCGDKSVIICGGDILIRGEQNVDKTVNNDWYKIWDRASSIGKYLIELVVGDTFKNLKNNLSGEIDGIFITGKSFKVTTMGNRAKDNNGNYIPVKDMFGNIKKDEDGYEMYELADDPPITPLKATIYADNDINLGDALVNFADVTFFFASKVKFIGTSSHTFKGVIDTLLSEHKTEYLFAIVDDDIDYNGLTDTVKANIFTTNQGNTSEVVKKIDDVYNESGNSGNRVINSIFSWIGINQNIQTAKPDEVNPDVSNLGLPKVLTEGSTDQSFAANVKQY